MRMRLLAGRRTTAQLLQMLEVALHKQAETWKPQSYVTPANTDVQISPEQRNETVKWLAQLTNKFRLYPETFVLSTSILDRFLHSVKARPRYLRVIGVAAFHLAAKTLEEDEVIPETLDIVHESMCGCSVAEVLRMERIILDKLHWDLHASSPLHFLHIFHSLILSKNPNLLDRVPNVTPSRQLGLLTDKMKSILCDHSLLVYPPATLAAAVLSLELELFAPEWLPMSLWILTLAKIDQGEMIRCREDVSRCMAFGRRANLVYVYRSRPTTLRATKRKMDDVMEEDDDDDIYDGIKRLYNEDAEPIAMATCAQEMRQESGAPAPPLQAAN